MSDLLDRVFPGGDDEKGAAITAGYHTPTRPEHEPAPAPEPDSCRPPGHVDHDVWPFRPGDELSNP
jgi:hypothetical protein